MTVIKTTVQNRWIGVPAPLDVPDGTPVVLTIDANMDDEAPLSAVEIANLIAAMHRLETWECPSETDSDLTAWEQRLNKHGIDHVDTGLEEVFP